MANRNRKQNRKSRLERQYWHATGFLGLYARAALRVTQFLLSLILIGIYSPDLTHATATSTRYQPPYIIAIIICILSAATCVYHVFVTVKRVALVCIWDSVLMVVWAAVTGTFGVVFVGEGNRKEDLREFTLDRKRMVASVWLSLVMMALWGGSAVMGCVWCCVVRGVTRGTAVPGKENEGEVDVERCGDVSEMANLDPVAERRESLNADNRGDSVGEEGGTVRVRGEGLKKIESPPPNYARFSV